MRRVTLRRQAAQRTWIIETNLRLGVFVDRLAGAPLDLIKVAAAVLMLGDHFNTVVLGSSVQLLWRAGRIAFPLFCFVLVCHLMRGVDPRRYAAGLLVLAVPTQPIFASAFLTDLGSIFFTLAAGAALAAVLASQKPWTQHAVLALGTAVVFAWPRARSGVDFGLPGMLLPPALLLTLVGSRAHAVWLIALLFALNAEARRGPGETWLSGLVIDGAFAAVGAGIIILAASRTAGSPRFLPSLALQMFYPGHLLVLVGLRSLVGGDDESLVHGSPLPFYEGRLGDPFILNS